MTSENQLLEQHIREYESRLQHFDELLERAGKAITEAPEHEDARTKLAELQKAREMLASQYDHMKLKLGENWEIEEIEKSGPMGIWDVVAQDVEHALEKLKL